MVFSRKIHLPAFFTVKFIKTKERIIMKKRNIIKSVTASLIFTLALSVSGCGENVTGGNEGVSVIHAVTAGSTAPYTTLQADGTFTGYDIEVLYAVFDKLPEYELDLQVSDREGIFSGLIAGNYQLAVNNYSYNEERAESYYYSFPYDEITYVYVQRAYDEPLTSFQDAADRGYKIEVSATNNITTALEKWNKENPDSQIQLIYSDATSTVWFEHIEDGIADFRIDDLPIYNANINEYGFQNLQSTRLSDEEVAKISTALDAYFLLPKTEEGAELREKINKALKELREDGTLLKLSEKYFGGDQVPDASKFVTPIN